MTYARAKSLAGGGVLLRAVASRDQDAKALRRGRGRTTGLHAVDELHDAAPREPGRGARDLREELLALLLAHAQQRAPLALLAPFGQNRLQARLLVDAWDHIIQHERRW